MNNFSEKLPALAGLAAMIVFGILLLWYLARYFSETHGRKLRFMCRYSAPVVKNPTPLWRILIWALVAFVVSRGLMFLGGAIAAHTQGDLAGYLDGFPMNWVHWDAHHYLRLIENWYVNEGDPRFHIVFFPLFPAIGRLIHLSTGLSPAFCGFFVANAAFLGCSIFMYKLGEITYGRRAGLMSMWLMNLSPLTLFCSIPYTESVFMLATLAAVYFARRQKFVIAVICGALSANSRMVGMATAIPIFYEMLRAYRGENQVKKYVSCVLRVLPVSLGLIAYIALNYQITGDPLRFLVYQEEHWSQTFGSLGHTLEYTLTNAIEFYIPSYRAGVWIPQTIAIILTLVLFVAVMRISHPGDMGYSLVCFYCSVAPTWLLSGPRYISAIYTVYPLTARLLRRWWMFMIACVLLAALCVIGGAMFAVDACIL